jgi:small subunit ribosomal protein S6
MALYEHIFMVRQDASTAQVEALTAQFKAVIEEHGGTVPKVEYWGVRSLTYRIRKNRKAHYTLFNLDAPAAAVAEMERQMSINEDTIRFMTVRVEELEEGQSAVLRSNSRRERDDERGSFGDRPDRGDRGDRGGFRGGDRGDRPGGGGGFRPDRERSERSGVRPRASDATEEFTS